MFKEKFYDFKSCRLMDKYFSEAASHGLLDDPECPEFGHAIAAYGIIDAGGRNVTVGSGFPDFLSFFFFRSQSGKLRVAAASILARRSLYVIVETLMFEVKGNFENGSLEPGTF